MSSKRAVARKRRKELQELSVLYDALGPELSRTHVHYLTILLRRHGFRRAFQGAVDLMLRDAVRVGALREPAPPTSVCQQATSQESPGNSV